MTAVTTTKLAEAAHYRSIAAKPLALSQNKDLQVPFSKVYPWKTVLLLPRKVLGLCSLKCTITALSGCAVPVMLFEVTVIPCTHHPGLSIVNYE